MALIGVYYSMILTSWTSIHEYRFESKDIEDNWTIWLRFGATIFGIAYCTFTSALNLANINKF